MCVNQICITWFIKFFIVLHSVLEIICNRFIKFLLTRTIEIIRLSDTDKHCVKSMHKWKILQTTQIIMIDEKCFKVHTLNYLCQILKSMLASKDCSVFKMRDYLLLLTITYRIKLSDAGLSVILRSIYLVSKTNKTTCKEIHWRILCYSAFSVFLFNSHANLRLFFARNYKSFFSSHKTQPSSIEMLRTCWKRKHK